MKGYSRARPGPLAMNMARGDDPELSPGPDPQPALRPEGDGEAAVSAGRAETQARTRVKVYILAGEEWQDAGTGYVTLNGEGPEHTLEVTAEDDGWSLLKGFRDLWLHERKLNTNA